MSEFEYLVDVHTGTGDGTNTDVLITFKGSAGQIENVALNSSSTNAMPFNRGQIDKFKIKSPYLGNIQSVSLKSDKSSTGVSWMVKSVNIKIVSPNTQSGDDTDFRFKFQKWFSNKNGWNHTAVQGMAIKSMVPVKGFATLHHTDKFKSQGLKQIILRRGACIKLKLALKRPFVESDGNFKIVLSSGKLARESNGTMAIAQHQSNKVYKEMVDQGKWAFVILETAGEDVVVEMNIPASAMVGRYKMVVEYKEEGVFEYPGDIVILFNPWCKGDEVYMDSNKDPMYDDNNILESNDDIEEYVLKQHGLIYFGSHENLEAQEWYFGQFEEISLSVVLDLLERVPNKNRLSIVEISRRFTAMCNHENNEGEDIGIVVGDWGDDFSAGHPPSFWTGSPVILNEYKKDINTNQYKSVKYGQCWVFAGVLTTCMRTLGIPCRPITNFNSSHDSNGNVTHDVYLDDENKSDSKWNFHVWNEVWFRRDDLTNDGEFDGWQIIDATPQERSQDYYQLGPAPLKAVKIGKVDMKFDTKFVFAEVNAEMIYWKLDGDKYKPTERRTDLIGRKISTKAVGSKARNDTTDEYKFAEGTLLEYGAVRKALRIARNPIIITEESFLDVSVTQVKKKNYSGEAVDFEFQVLNKSREDQTVELIVKTYLTHYTGEIFATLSTNIDQPKVKVGKGTVHKTAYSVSPDKYVPHMRGDDYIQVNLIATIPSIGYLATNNKTIHLMKPEIKMMVQEEKSVISGKEFDVEISFENPLQVPLFGGKGYFGGSALEKTVFVKIGNIPARGKFQKTYKITPIKVGGHNKKKSLMFSFSCKPIGGFSESMRIKVSADAI